MINKANRTTDSNVIGELQQSVGARAPRRVLRTLGPTYQSTHAILLTVKSTGKLARECELINVSQTPTTLADDASDSGDMVTSSVIYLALFISVCETIGHAGWGKHFTSYLWNHNSKKL